jgi:hypothetical protein
MNSPNPPLATTALTEMEAIMDDLRGILAELGEIDAEEIES